MDWSDVIRRFKDLRSLIDTKPVFRWGVITNNDPLLVQLDGDDRPIAGLPSTIIGGLAAGERVLCMVQNRRVTVIGRGGDEGSNYVTLAGLQSLAQPWELFNTVAGISWPALSTAPAEIRLNGKRVEMRGGLSNSNAFTTYSKLGTIPVKYRPSQRVVVSAAAPAGTVRKEVWIEPNGDIMVYSSSSGSSGWFFDFVYWYLD